ncbi:DUF4442 domain-containing protein [Chitinophaga tropicalis]|uniref:DUF4442 domain-containing protein n=1 Tax=Chitinophaga tropicalis TaxID=2683588 RepID=A0A7K1UEF8_9BACT|nr:DUF4442 domain-containing protein [Chitinophaga tropicalis]MVT12355.1 DUF4442 domain-containing protein [Chitinophaga tropicalis]
MESTPLKAGAADFMRLAVHPLKFSLYLLWKLPSAWLAGVRLKQLTAEHCITVVPYRWLSQNPFRSTYFACLAMAAEMSTGIPAIMYTREALPRKVSMLVTGMKADFVKKATGKTWFTCNGGTMIREAVAKTIATGEPVTITVESIGKSPDGTVIASFEITWSFKAKT